MKNWMNWKNLWEATYLLSPCFGQVKQPIYDKFDHQNRQSPPPISQSQGLGAQEQGNPEHIRVKVKNNTLGLGANINHEDNWIAHQDDFNQLLAELNNCHGQGETEPSVKNQKKTFSLEEKSKSSKKRVHYMKFAKGKDLSSCSEHDLSCIFGRRQKSGKTQPPVQACDKIQWMDGGDRFKEQKIMESLSFALQPWTVNNQKDHSQEVKKYLKTRFCQHLTGQGLCLRSNQDRLVTQTDKEDNMTVQLKG
ncbi:hypothetical protein BTVI_150457 [Pitangus sulphuratus]|nr:hypothetical protein BTVI_150457 [Pitangus sulphuratus]